MLGFAGLALSVALSAVIQVGILAIVASRRYGPMGYAGIFWHWIAFLVMAAFAVIPPWVALSKGWMSSIPFGILGQTVIAIAFAALIYLFLTWLLGYRSLGIRRSASRSG